MPREDAASVDPRVEVASVETNDFTLSIPAGYRDATRELASADFDIVLARGSESGGYEATIVVRKVPIPGGSFDDPTECRNTGNGLVQGGALEPGTGGELKSARIVDGPVGKTCQIHLVAPQGVAILTELHLPGNTRSSPKEIWLMTCNHAEGDAAAESECRVALSGFRFR